MESLQKVTPEKLPEKPSEKSVIHKVSLGQETEVTPVVKGNENEKEVQCSLLVLILNHHRWSFFLYSILFQVYVKEKPDYIPSSSKPKTLIPSDRDKPAGLDMHDFLPVNCISIKNYIIQWNTSLFIRILTKHDKKRCYVRNDSLIFACVHVFKKILMIFIVLF